jgi:hypothetical protein
LTGRAKYLGAESNEHDQFVARRSLSGQLAAIDQALEHSDADRPIRTGRHSGADESTVGDSTSILDSPFDVDAETELLDSVWDELHEQLFSLV